MEINMSRHIYNPRTLICSCGRTKEQHLKIELTNLRIKEKWLNGDVDIEKDFAELDNVLNN